MSYFVFRMTVQSYNLMRGDCRGLMTLGKNCGGLSRIVGVLTDYEWVMWMNFCIFVGDLQKEIPLVKGAGGCSISYVKF